MKTFSISFVFNLKDLPDNALEDNYLSSFFVDKAYKIFDDELMLAKHGNEICFTTAQEGVSLTSAFEAASKKMTKFLRGEEEK